MPAELSSISARTHLIKRMKLLDRAKAFCTAFSAKQMPTPKTILNEHFTKNSPRITEHCPNFAQARLPFLGRTFEGVDGCLEYFRLLGETLKFEPADDCFPTRDSGFVVDPEAKVSNADEATGYGSRTGAWAGGVVSVVGHGTFTSVRTGKAWDEQFIYRLSEFDEEGKVGHWEIWADPLSAWLAVGGEETLEKQDEQDAVIEEKQDEQVAVTEEKEECSMKEL